MKKTLKNRIVSGIMSAAMLASGALSAAAPAVNVSAADNDYYQALALSLYFFDANACGSDVDEGPLTWRGDCHVEDEKALISNATNFDSSYKSLVDPDGDGKFNVGGGYHDAGDHIKFNLTMGFGMSSLAMSEYLNPGIYDKAGCKAHLIDILKRNADYMMKTTYLDSSGNVATICYVVADGGVDHSMMTPPEEQHYDRATYWLTANKNNSAVCGEMAAALAGTAYVVKDSDANYAKECLKYAKALYNFGTQHKGNEMTGQSPYYSTDEDSQDELLLAQAWLYINGEGSKPTVTPNNGQYSGKYDCYRYTWDKVYQGYAALMYKATKDSAFKKELEYEVNNAGGVNAGKYNGDGWGAARYNCGLQMSALAAADGNSSSALATGSKWQMDYILGDNPKGYSFLIGYGSKWPTHIHHRAANPGDLSSNPAAKYTLYGGLVGGIDASGNYEDHSDKYQYTEGALDYNGCFALACAGLADLFGGSDKGASKIVSSASEFKQGYSFGSGSTVTPTPSTDEPKTTTAPAQSTDKVETTAKPVETTKATTTTKAPTTVTGKKDANITVVEAGKQWTVDVSGATKLTITFKTNSSDTETNGVFNVAGGWNPVDWKASVSNGTATATFEVPSGTNSVDFYIWWPNSATIESAVLDVQEVATTKATTATTKATTTVATTTTTKATEKVEEPTSGGLPAVTKYGDADGNGIVDIADVLTINQYLLGIGGEVTPQGRANADVTKDGKIGDDDALLVLKSLVDLATL
ncbi:MAG: glycoside hydrolase family 9 protein [Oscillospiraceae bacterium]